MKKPSTIETAVPKSPVGTSSQASHPPTITVGTNGSHNTTFSATLEGYIFKGITNAAIFNGSSKRRVTNEVPRQSPHFSLRLSSSRSTPSYSNGSVNSVGIPDQTTRKREDIATCRVCTRIPTSEYGVYYLYLYTSSTNPSREHLAIVFSPNIRSKSLEQEPPSSNAIEQLSRTPASSHQSSLNAIDENKCAEGENATLVRIHSECFTGETVLSARCDCGEQLQTAMSTMSSEGSGVIIYLRQEGRGIGLLEKLKAYNIQDHGFDTAEANAMLGHPVDARDYVVAKDILEDLGIRRVRLMTNNPDKVFALKEMDVEVVERVPIVTKKWSVKGDADANGCVGEVENGEAGTSDLDKYLLTKVHSMGHQIPLPPSLQALPRGSARSVSIMLEPDESRSD